MSVSLSPTCTNTVKQRIKFVGTYCHELLRTLEDPSRFVIKNRPQAPPDRVFVILWLLRMTYLKQTLPVFLCNCLVSILSICSSPVHTFDQARFYSLSHCPCRIDADAVTQTSITISHVNSAATNHPHGHRCPESPRRRIRSKQQHDYCTVQTDPSLRIDGSDPITHSQSIHLSKIIQHCHITERLIFLT